MFQEGKTALFYAVEKGHTACVKMLAEHNPNFEMETSVSIVVLSSI